MASPGKVKSKALFPFSAPLIHFPKLSMKAEKRGPEKRKLTFSQF
jgi:hypothetical protein